MSLELLQSGWWQVRMRFTIILLDDKNGDDYLLILLVSVIFISQDFSKVDVKCG